MIASAYAQIVPTRRQDGSVVSVKIGNVTQGPPYTPEPGALLVRLRIAVDEDVFAIPNIDIELDAEGSAIAAAIVPVPVDIDELDDDQEPAA